MHFIMCGANLNKNNINILTQMSLQLVGQYNTQTANFNFN